MLLLERNEFQQELVVFNSPPIDVYILLYYDIVGKNGQIPLFLKIFYNLPLFAKYLAIYDFFET